MGKNCNIESLGRVISLSSFLTDCNEIFLGIVILFFNHMYTSLVCEIDDVFCLIY
jgi:hypothetical protein